MATSDWLFSWIVILKMCDSVFKIQLQYIQKLEHWQKDRQRSCDPVSVLCMLSVLVDILVDLALQK